MLALLPPAEKSKAVLALSFQQGNFAFESRRKSYFISTLFKKHIYYKCVFGCSGSWLLHRGSSLVTVDGLLLAGASLFRERRLSSTRPSAAVACRLQRAGSRVMAHGLSCPTTCRTFLAESANQHTLRHKADAYHWTTREALHQLL